MMPAAESRVKFTDSSAPRVEGTIVGDTHGTKTCCCRGDNHGHVTFPNWYLRELRSVLIVAEPELPLMPPATRPQGAIASHHQRVIISAGGCGDWPPAHGRLGHFRRH